MMKLLILIIVLCLGFFLFVRYIEQTGIFFPQKEIEVYPNAIGLPFEDVYFKTQDNLLLNGWLVKNPAGQETVLFFHGNAGNISHRLEKISLFYGLGLNVFIVDYRGYGKSQGAPSEQGLYRDALAAFDYLGQRKDINKNKIIGYGESLGGAVLIDLAAHRPFAALIIDSCFSSAADMARQYYPFIPHFLLKTKMDSVAKIKNVRIPKLFIHSREDEIVPFALAQKLFNAACEPKEFLETKGDHNTGYQMAKDQYMLGIQDFLKKQGLLP